MAAEGPAARSTMEHGGAEKEQKRGETQSINIWLMFSLPLQTGINTVTALLNHNSVYKPSFRSNELTCHLVYDSKPALLKAEADDRTFNFLTKFQLNMQGQYKTPHRKGRLPLFCVLVPFVL